MTNAQDDLNPDVDSVGEQKRRLALVSRARNHTERFQNRTGYNSRSVQERLWFESVKPRFFASKANKSVRKLDGTLEDLRLTPAQQQVFLDYARTRKESDNFYYYLLANGIITEPSQYNRFMKRGHGGKPFDSRLAELREIELAMFVALNGYRRSELPPIVQSRVEDTLRGYAPQFVSNLYGFETHHLYPDLFKLRNSPSIAQEIFENDFTALCLRNVCARDYGIDEPTTAVLKKKDHWLSTLVGKAHRRGAFTSDLATKFVQDIDRPLRNINFLKILMAGGSGADIIFAAALKENYEGLKNEIDGAGPITKEQLARMLSYCKALRKIDQDIFSLGAKVPTRQDVLIAVAGRLPIYTEIKNRGISEIPLKRWRAVLAGSCELSSSDEVDQAINYLLQNPKGVSPEIFGEVFDHSNMARVTVAIGNCRSKEGKKLTYRVSSEADPIFLGKTQGADYLVGHIAFNGSAADRIARDVLRRIEESQAAFQSTSNTPVGSGESKTRPWSQNFIQRYLSSYNDRTYGIEHTDWAVLAFNTAQRFTISSGVEANSAKTLS